MEHVTSGVDTLGTVAGFVEAVVAFRLLKPAQQQELVQVLRPGYTDAKALAGELVRREWLTSYQSEELLQGRGQGLLLEPYVLLELLGEGGMGQVFKARDQKLERVVALKIILPARMTGADSVRRFQREARASARLSHPNIVTVHAADESAGRCYLAMEYLEGIDLSELVQKNGPLPVHEACHFVHQTALGLQHAHERGLVHRDIKPHNLFVTTPSGSRETTASRSKAIKILDMGLARFDQFAEGQTSTAALTQEGTVMGTPDYLSPEQARNSHAVDIRADLYSLGCTLYFLLTGQPPFPGGSLTEKLIQHQMEEPKRLEKLRPEVPIALSAVVKKLMAKKPADRYQTPAEAASALAPFCRAEFVESSRKTQKVESSDDESGSQRRPRDARRTLAGQVQIDTAIWESSRKKRLRLWIAVAGGSVLLATVLGLLFLFSGSREDPARQTRAKEDSPRKSVERKVSPKNVAKEATSKGKSREKRITNSAGMVFVLIPAGKFQMGSPAWEKERRKDESLREVIIPEPFYLGIHEVTQEQYEKVMGENPSSYQKRKGGGPDFPVENVSFEDARSFCRRLTDLPEEKRAERRYRLPSEAEWEYACRAGTTTPFHYGDSLSSAQANFNGTNPYGSAGKGPNLGNPTKVGSYTSKHAFGLFDMHGNVAEWCLDGDAVGAEASSAGAGSQQGVLRGGAFPNNGATCRSASRRTLPPSEHYGDAGFRVLQFFASDEP